MKVSSPKDGGNDRKKELPPLPLKPEPVTEDSELKLAKFKLRTDPADANSPTYSFTITKLDGSEPLHIVLHFYKSVRKIWTGLNITAAANMLNITRELVTGSALQQFNEGYNAALITQWQVERTTAVANLMAATPNSSQAQQDAASNGVVQPVPRETFILAGLCQVITYMAPHKALAKQKRWMRRFCRKPADMTIREFTNHITRINDEELPILPPFGGITQKLSDDEIIDIILNGIPRSWMREMDRLDFDPVSKSLHEVLHFMERMEAAEDFDPARNGGKTTATSKKSGKSSKTNTKSNGQGGNQYCLLHGNNTTHNSDDCYVLKKQAEKLKGDGGGKMSASKNKTWKRDSNKSTSTSKKELAAFVRKQARKELHAFAKEAKKRKFIDEESDDDDNSNASLNQMDEEKEEGEIDISAFNYKDMDDLKIDSEDEDGDGISV